MEEYITQVSEEIENRKTKRLSQKFGGTESTIMGVPSKLEEFLLIPQVRIQSGIMPGTSLNKNIENQELTEDLSRNDPRPEVDATVYWSAQPMGLDLEETSYIDHSRNLMIT